jgi:hypothetical protein
MKKHISTKELLGRKIYRTRLYRTNASRRKKMSRGVGMDLGHLRLSKGETNLPRDIDPSPGRLNGPKLERPSETWSSRPPLVYWMKSDSSQMTKYTLYDGRCDRYIGEVLFTSLGRCRNGGMVHDPRWINQLYVCAPNETLSSWTSFLLCVLFFLLIFDLLTISWPWIFLTGLELGWPLSMCVGDW